MKLRQKFSLTPRLLSYITLPRVSPELAVKLVWTESQCNAGTLKITQEHLTRCLIHFADELASSRKSSSSLRDHVLDFMSKQFNDRVSYLENLCQPLNSLRLAGRDPATRYLQYLVYPE